MRVNLSFGENIEDLPAELQRLVQKAMSEMEEVLESLHDLEESVLDGNPYTNYQAVEAIRLSLPPIDSRLEDLQTLLKGYQSALTQMLVAENSQQATPQTSAPQAAPPQQSVEELLDMADQSVGHDFGGGDEEK